MMVKFLGFKNETIANLGAYARVFGTVTPTYLFGPCATGVYDNTSSLFKC